VLRRAGRIEHGGDRSNSLGTLKGKAFELLTVGKKELTHIPEEGRGREITTKQERGCHEPEAERSGRGS